MSTQSSSPVPNQPVCQMQSVFTGSIHELLSSIRSTSQDFGLEGLIIPKKSEQLSKPGQNSPPRPQKADNSKYNKDPSPASYSPTLEKTEKDYWSPSNGKFDKAKKWNYIDQILKVHSSIPGPGDYERDHWLNTRGSLGRITEAEGIFGNLEILTQATLSPSHYFSEGLKRKELSAKKRRFSTFKSPEKVEKVREKSLVGPGYLPGLEKSYFMESGKRKAPSVSFPRSKEPRIISQKTFNDRIVPGVGTYRNVDLAYSHNIVKQKSRSTFISNSSLNRYTETAARQKSWIPGPGSYNLFESSKSSKKH